MHILHFVKTSEGAKWTLDFIKDSQLHFDGITHSVVIPEGGKYFQEYKNVCINVLVLDFAFNFKILKNGLLLRRLVKKENPDIIHSWFTQTTFYARLFLRDINIPRLFEVVGPMHLESKVYRFFDIYSAQKQDYWKATSEYTFNKYLNHGVPQRKLFMNYIGLDLIEYLDSKESSPLVNIRETYGLDDDIKIIGTSSYMYPPKFLKKVGVKNHEMLLEVFAELLKRRDDVVLVIGGTTLGKDKEYVNQLKRKANTISTDKIFFAGFVHNLGQFISEFDVFVFLSISENLGGVFESLLFEVPTVASDRGGIPELVINGETGFTCSLKSVDEIVNKIEKVLDDDELSKKFRNKGKEKVFEVFHKDASIENSYDIYKKLLSLK
jgi:glycosyltransferase involved in cell wall biosynthesis